MTEVRVEIENGREFLRELGRIDPYFERELKDAIREGTGKVAVTAGALAPRESGALQHSIRAYVSGVRASVGSTLPYAGWLEFGGTIRPRGVPITIRGAGMVQRAVDDHADEIVEDIADGFDRAAYKAGWHPGR
jgi:phage gpG-like protein